MKRIYPIEYDEHGEPIIHLSADAANDDWPRAARLKRAGKLDELKELEATLVFVEGEKYLQKHIENKED